jgi:hypothetical protein
LRVRLPPSTQRTAPRLLSGNGKHASPVRRQSRFDSSSRLSVTVVSAESTWPRHGHRTSSNLVGHSRAVLVQLARDAAFRAQRFGVRVPGTVLRKVNRPGRRAPLLADAAFRRWLSNSPPSSEDEPARWLAPAGNRAAANGRGFRLLRPLPSPACSHRAGEQFVSGE